MGVIQRKITGESVYQAILANGVPLIRGRWFDTDVSGKPVGACLIGMAALNLHVAANSDFATNTGDSLVDQLDRFALPETNKWYDDNSDNLIGSAMVNYYDAYATDPNTGRVALEDDGYTYKWKVPDDEIPQFLREILEPVWNETFTVDSYEFEFNSAAIGA
jgi:hypothetical protein